MISNASRQAPPESVRRAVHVLIEGRVQGVGFRAWTELRAHGLGLDGWVRNRRTGAVEAVFAGDPGAVEQFLKDCEQGPPAAGVADVLIIDTCEYAGSGFEVRATA